MGTRYNIKPDLVKVLKGVNELKKISSATPKEWSDFPCAVYSTKAKPDKMDLSMNEILTHWTINIELYDSRSALSDLSEQVIAALKDIGFKNDETSDGNVTGLFRMQLKFTGIVNNKTLLVTH